MFNPVHAIKTLHPGYRYRSAITGEYVSRLYAALHKDTTIRERIK